MASDDIRIGSATIPIWAFPVAAGVAVLGGAGYLLYESQVAAKYALSPTSDDLPRSGGTVDFTVSSGKPFTTLYVLQDGVQVQTVDTDAGGNASFTLAFPPNASAEPVVHEIEVSDVAPTGSAVAWYGSLGAMR